MMDYKATIFHVVKKFDEERNAMINGWNDDNQKMFYAQHLDPIIHDICVKGGYIDKVGEILELMAHSKNQIDSLVGSTTPFYAGTPHERGDRVDGTYASKDNTVFIATDFFNNKSR